MSLRDKFVKRGFMLMELEKFLRSRFDRAGFSHIELENVPLGTRIVIYAERPGLIIGRGGEKVVKLTKVIQKKFEIQNPQIDIQAVAEPELDPNVVAKRIADAVAKGMNYRRVGNMALKRIIDSGAIGAYIRIAGKLGGDKSRFEKFSAGYLKHCGEPSRVLMRRGQAEAWTKMGLVGVIVKIMPNTPEVLEILGYSAKALAQRSLLVQESGSEEAPVAVSGKDAEAVEDTTEEVVEAAVEAVEDVSTEETAEAEPVAEEKKEE